jgi:hypothetical protein
MHHPFDPVAIDYAKDLLSQHGYVVFQLPVLTDEQREARLQERADDYGQKLSEAHEMYLSTPEAEATGFAAVAAPLYQAAVEVILLEHVASHRRTLTSADLNWLELRDTHSFFKDMDERCDAINDHMAQFTAEAMARNLAVLSGARPE